MSININDTDIDFKWSTKSLDREDKDKKDDKPTTNIRVRDNKETKKKVKEKSTSNLKEDKEFMKALHSLSTTITPDKKPRNSKKMKQPDIPTDEMGEKKQDLIMKLIRYGENARFSKYLKDMSFKLTSGALNNKSVEALEELLSRVRYSIANRSNDTFMDDMIKNGFMNGELLIHMKTRAKIKGTTALLWQNEQFLDDLEAVKLEYLNFGGISPKARLCLTITKTAFICHSLNTDPRLANIQPTNIKKPKDKNKTTTDKNDVSLGSKGVDVLSSSQKGNILDTVIEDDLFDELDNDE